MSDQEQQLTVPGPNGGVLRVGNWGNKGGPGRPRHVVRALAREVNETAMARAKSMVDDPDVDLSMHELAGLIAATGRLGLGDAQPEVVGDEEVVSRIFAFLAESGVDVKILAGYEAWAAERF